MHIYLRHPRHGSKVAIAEAEAVADEKNGWVRYDPGTVPPPAPPGDVNFGRRRIRGADRGTEP